MGRIIVKNVIKRRPGYLYYLDGKGNVCEAKMSRGGKRKKKKKVVKRKPAKRKVAKRKPAKRKKPAKRRKRR